MGGDLINQMLHAADVCEMAGWEWEAEQMRTGAHEIQRLAAGLGTTLPKEPPPGLLMSMAVRYDHGLGCPGYYDMLGEGEHERRLEAALTAMRQIYEEISGFGFYRPNLEEQYRKLQKGECLQGGRHDFGKGVVYITPAKLTHCLRCGAEIRGRTEADLVPMNEQDRAILMAITEELEMTGVLDDAFEQAEAANGG